MDQRVHRLSFFRPMVGRGMIVFAVILYAWLALTNIKYPGLYYDEALFINAALGAPDNDSFVASRFMGIPTMTMPYIGVVKSILFAPIFATLGVNIFTIRIPAVLLSCGILVVCYLIARRFTNDIWAGCLALLLAADPSFVLHTRSDHGPIVMMILLKMLAILFAYRAFDRRSWKYLALSGVALLLGIWDKLNFVWFVLAFLVSMLVYYREMLALYRAKPAHFVAIAIVFFSGLALIYFKMILPLMHHSEQPLSAFYPRLIVVLESCQRTLAGTAYCDWVFSDFSPSPAYYPTVTIAALVWALLIVVLSRGKEIAAEDLKASKGILFFSLIFGAILAQIVLTPEAGGPHHFMVLWPFHYLIAFLFASLVMRRCPAQLSKLCTAGALCGAVIVLVHNAAIAHQVTAELPERPLNPLWSNAVYDLSRVVRSEADNYSWVLSTDWGTGTQVSALAYGRQRRKCQDLWMIFPTMRQNDSSEKWIDSMAAGGPILAILYAPGLSKFPQNRTGFFDFTRDMKMDCKLVGVVNDIRGPCYELYSVSRKSPRL